MRFTEIINPEDQLALWRLISDKVWSTFGQIPLQPNATDAVPATPKPASKTISRLPAKTLGKAKVIPLKKGRPKKAPIAPPPKPLPKPKQPLPTLAQTNQAQTQQHQQLAKHIHQALTDKPPVLTYPKPIPPKEPVAATTATLNNSYSERDKDELVLHRREDPFRSLKDQKPL
jgi:hypothetical protein